MSLLSEIKKISGTPKQLREFGWVMGGFFGILLALGWFKHREANMLWLGLAVFFLFASLFLRPPLQVLYRPWMGLALVLGAVMSRVILVVLFVVAVCPIALFLRVSGRDILNKRWQKGEGETLWMPHKSPKDKAQYESQF